MLAETVAAIIKRDGLYLIIEEHTADGVKLNQPAGHIESGETPEQAVIRETMEEACVLIRPIRLISCQMLRGHSVDPNLLPLFRRSNFEAEIFEEKEFLDHSPEIIRRLWLTKSELEERSDQLRSPAVLSAIEDYEALQRISPIESMNH